MKRFRELAGLAVLLCCAACSSEGASIPSLPSISGVDPNFVATYADGNQVAVQPSPLDNFSAAAYRLQSFQAGYVVDIYKGNFNDYAPLDNYPSIGGINQMWRFVAATRALGSYQIQNTGSGKCMDAASANSGANVVINTCNNRVTGQQWTAVVDANQNLTFRNLGNGLCMEVENANPNLAAPLVLAPCGRSGQLWSVLNKTLTTAYGHVVYETVAANNVNAFSVTLIVPAQPQATGALFTAMTLRPQFETSNYLPIGGGALGPVLTWGTSCSPATQPTAYATWWISGQYINSGGQLSGYSGCNSGNVMTVSPNDRLTITMTLNGNTWNETILDVNTGNSVNYALDMLGQMQGIVDFGVTYSGVLPAGDIIFENMQFSVGEPDPAMCSPSVMGTNDFVAAGVLSKDMRTCSVAKLITRAQGVAATSPND